MKRCNFYAILSDGVLESSKDKGNTGSTLNRNSTIYSKPVWPAEAQSSTDSVKEHNYATIPGEQERQCDTGAYSYAYQHQACPQTTTKPQEREGNARSAYQELGAVDYMHMYSKPSPLLVGSTAVKKSTHVEEKRYQKIESTTLNAESVYTKPIQTPEKLG